MGLGDVADSMTEGSAPARAAGRVRRIFGASYAGVVSAVYIATFLARVAFGIVVVTFARYVPPDVLNDLQYGLLIAANPLFELLAVVAIGLVIDRYGRRGVLLAGLALGAASLVALATTRSVPLLAVFNALHGVSAAAILVPTLAILADHAPPKSRGREMGGFNFVQMFGWFSGFVLGFVLQEVFAEDLRLTFILAGGLALLGLVYAFLVLEEPDADTPVIAAHLTFRQALDGVMNRSVMSVTIPWFLVFLFVGSFLAFLGRTATDVLQLHGFSTAVWMLFLAVVFLTTQVVFGRLSDTYGRDPFMLLGGLGFFGLMATIAVGFQQADADTAEALLASVGRYAPLLVLFVVAALAFPPAALAALADSARADLRGTTMAIYSLFISLGMILGPISVGAASQYGGHEGVLAFFLGVAIALLLALLGRVRVVRGAFAKARARLPQRP